MHTTRDVFASNEIASGMLPQHLSVHIRRNYGKGKADQARQNGLCP